MAEYVSKSTLYALCGQRDYCPNCGAKMDVEQEE